mgnify:CR=1 FL=1
MKFKSLAIFLIISSFFLTCILSIWKIMSTLQGLSFTNFGLVFVIYHPSLVIRLYSPKVTRHTQELWLIGFPLSFDSMFPVPPNNLYSLFIRGNRLSIVTFNLDTYLTVTTRLINDKQYKTLFE